jgi:17beta-estradiol 17-dehydrogenase / 3beta-hydroxysteroid 3-dehydrogenase
MKTNTKVAVITGASSGIGEAIARDLAQRGYRLCLTARREDRLQALAQELSGLTEVIIECADMRSEPEIRQVFRRTEAQWGGQLDLLVNSAGLGRIAPLMSGSSAAWREMFDVNVIGLSIATQLAVDAMRTRNDTGLIIHISSMSGHRVPDGTGGMYSATKHAVRALTEGLRRELRSQHSNIRVCAISPGFVETEFASVMTGDEDKAAEVYARFKCLTAQDIAQSVAFVVDTPAHMQVHDILIRPTHQEN